MIKVILILCFAIMQISCFRSVELEGNVERKAVKKVNLYSYTAGKMNQISDASVDEKGYFRFKMLPSLDGVYWIGENEKVFYPIYLKDGEKLSVRITRNCILLEGDVGEENYFLNMWENRIKDVREHAFLYSYIPQGHSVKWEEFFDEFSELFRWRMEYIQRLQNLENDVFADYLKYKSDVDLNFYALSYLSTQRIKAPCKIPEYECYKKIKLEQLFQDKRLLDIPYVGEMLCSYVWFVEHVLDEGTIGYKIFKSDLLKEKYLLTIASSFKFYDDYRQFYDKIEPEILKGRLIEQLSTIEDELAWSMPGIEAPNFKGIKQDGSFLSLSDFRGKIVVVDVWATWCAPCRMMMPYFVRLEKELKMDDVVFVSVCMGVSIEKESWLEIIEKDHLEGNLCFVDSWTGEFAKNYRITGVPRYMVFDREGKIVSVKAPFPNSPELKNMILKLLSK